MDLKNISSIESATKINRKELFRMGTALLFIVGIMLFTYNRLDSNSGIYAAGDRCYDWRLYGAQYWRQ